MSLYTIFCRFIISTLVEIITGVIMVLDNIDSNIISTLVEIVYDSDALKKGRNFPSTEALYHLAEQCIKTANGDSSVALDELFARLSLTEDEKKEASIEDE